MNASELKPFRLLAELSANDREAIAEHLESDDMKKGARLFAQGDEADGLALIVTGRVQIEREGKGALGTLGDGAVLGALSLVTVGPREVTAVAQSKCQVLWLRRTAFHRLMENAPRAASRLLEAILSDVGSMLRQGLERFGARSG